MRSVGDTEAGFHVGEDFQLSFQDLTRVEPPRGIAELLDAWNNHVGRCLDGV